MDKPSESPSESFPVTSPLDWNEQRCQAAVSLASGHTHQETADEVGVTKRTITNWLQHDDFAAEVDRLSLMVGIASRAERLRIAMRVIRQKTKGSLIDTDKDVLDWIKFAQSETTGANLNFLGLAAQLADVNESAAEPPLSPPMAGSGLDGDIEPFH